LLATATHDTNPLVARAAWEALATGHDLAADVTTPPAWSAALASKIRRVRAAAIAVARATGHASYQEHLAKHPTESSGAREQLARLWINLPDHPAESGESGNAQVFAPDEFQTCLRTFAGGHADPTLRLEAVRLMQLGLGDLKVSPGKAEVYTGYLGIGADQVDSANRSLVARQLAPAFPTGDPELDRELARLLGMLSADDPQLLAAIARKSTADSTVEDDIHYLIVASLLTGPRSAETTAATARCLLGLHAKLDTRGQLVSRNWPQRVGEAFDELMRRDSALASAVATSDQLEHPEHAEFVEHLAEPERSQATKRLWQAVVAGGRTPTAEMVALAGKLPEQDARPLVEAVWDEVGLRDAIVLVLAKHPRTADRAKFIEALSSPQPAVVERAAKALVHLGMNATSDEMAAALRALKQACGIPKSPEPRQSLLALLNFWTEENSDVDEDPDPAKVYIGWYKMFADYYPATAKKLNASASADSATWRTRLAAVDWLSGDAQRGRAVFERRACHRCHQVSGHLGPELKGAVARMSRDDLFTAIVDPNLEVAPAFQTTMIATNAGQVYHGLVVYESPESTLLQTGPDTTVRITNTETSSMRRSNQSLMPTGLLETLTDRDLSDLYAYLKTLGK
jgi:putative heme-binding domain-containing protein